MQSMTFTTIETSKREWLQRTPYYRTSVKWKHYSKQGIFAI